MSSPKLRVCGAGEVVSQILEVEIYFLLEPDVEPMRISVHKLDDIDRL